MQTTDASSSVVDTEFDLDVRVVTDLSPEMAIPCDTQDGCASTCASSCISNA